MELRHLRYFVAVYETRNVTRAAAMLGIQQPPLSQQIKGFETELGVLLFRRTAKGMVPTASATALYERAVTVLREVDESVDVVQAVARGEQGRIAIGVSSSAAFSPVIPRLIRAFRASHPAVSVSLNEDAAEELVQGVRLQKTDIVFTRSVPEDLTDLALITLLEEEMLAAVPAGHPVSKRGGDGIELRRLAQEPFILYRRPGGPGLFDSIVAACRSSGFSPKIAEEALRLPSTLNFVAAELGVSIVPASLRRMRIEGVVYLRLIGCPDLRAPLNVAYQKTPDAAARQFIQRARNMRFSRHPS